MIYSYLTTLRTIADHDPDRLLVITPERRLTAGELVAEVDHLAGWLTTHRVVRGRPVGIMLWNRAEFVVGFYAALAVGAPPVNVNPRYGAAEAMAVLSDCDAGAVLHEPTLSCHDIAALRAAGISTLDAVGEWGDAMAAPPAPVRDPQADDVLINYTGGTTGTPKGVVWSINVHYRMLWEIMRPGSDPPLPAQVATGSRRSPTAMPLSPLAHATAQGLALNALNGGGTLVLTGSDSFDPASVLDRIEELGVVVLGIVGDVFAKPLLDTLEVSPHKLETLKVITSSGAIWSAAVRDRLRELLPHVQMVDNYGSTEALITRNAGNSTNFEVRPGVVVLDKDLRPMEPGTGEVGLIATSGRLPIGYLNDPEKTAATFPTIDGVRYLVVGDEAILEADGSIRMLGRGNATINTGGEKVWPEEVETVLKAHPAVHDVAVVGESDKRWGQRVVGVVAIARGADPSDKDLADHVRAGLAGYKVPKRFVRVDSVPRTYAGKPDYDALRAIVATN